MSGPFRAMTLTCPDCKQEWEGIALWAGGYVSCTVCVKAANERRMEAIQAPRAYTIEEIGGACPTQATGRFSNGRPFYFRARHGHWTLEVGQPDWPTDYQQWPDRHWEDLPEAVASGDDPANGWMEDADVLAILDAHEGSAPA